ncbi:A24 family peptidase [Adlercreutzia equolifaciens]|uniref:prepilin peptidase n=1 Tax=Adlercreutzia equolifaciens TaxID=446660 RepID=UPI0023AF5DCB|nr:A24 family peptidase [Adlercreutzia equolifaciens]MDE8701605.1 A24 family peptidase [Adlercreutzia equolifaciens]
MTYLSGITLAAYGLVVLLLVAATVTDVRTRRIPNLVPLAIVALWGLWRIVLGFAGMHTGLGFVEEMFAPAPDVTVPPGLEIGGITVASGILGAVVLGGGLLVLTVGYEAFTHKQAFGGGDIKLMAALGLFLGLERGIVCLMVACVCSLIYAVIARRIAKAAAPARGAAGEEPAGLAQCDGCDGRNGRSGHDGVVGPGSRAGHGGDDVRLEREKSFGATVLPFGPFIALGALVAFVF